ncbi:four-carbon acid sugar kinase family protein [Agrobacterium sp. 22-226-1]
MQETSPISISPISVGIVADDLTSAADGAVAFLGKAGAPLILRSSAAVPDQAVVAIDANSRTLAAAGAALTTATAIAALRNRSILFKTIDSTLRGHVREEIAAAFRASGRRRLVIAPAFPEAGRLTDGGLQTIHGIPVSQSDYGRDPVHPARTSTIAELIESSLSRVVVVAKDQEAGTIDEADALILDADSQETLNRQAARFPDPGDILWVGSPGLAIALAALVPVAATRDTMQDIKVRRTLIVAGSANPVTHAQCGTMQDQGIPVIERMADAPADARIVCLRAPSARRTDPATLLTALAGEASASVMQDRYDSVIATGGETMAAILDRLGITGFTLVGEMEPGFPVGRTTRAHGSPLVIAMKAGGFGSPDTLLRAAQALSGERISGKVY